MVVKKTTTVRTEIPLVMAPGTGRWWKRYLRDLRSVGCRIYFVCRHCKRRFKTLNPSNYSKKVFMHAIYNNHFCSGRCRTEWWNVKRTKDGTFARYQKKKRSEQKGVLDLNCLAQLESIKKILDHGWDPDENKNDKKITSHFQNRALEFRRVLIRLREGGFNLIKDFDPKFKELIASYKVN